MRSLEREERFNLLSVYFGRWASVVIFVAIVALAVAAVFVDSDDLAHMQVIVGVSAFDSMRSSAALRSFSDFCRQKGRGDIQWRFFSPGEKPSRCDFYLMPALEAVPYLEATDCRAALLVAEREAHRYSRSAVIARRGNASLPVHPRIIFSSPTSAAGFVAAYRALEAAGVLIEEADIDFSGNLPREERTILGVVHGVYDAGGISQERLESFKAAGFFSPDELEILYRGEAVPEMVLVCEPSDCTRQRERFARSFRRSFDQAPQSLRRELSSIGIASLYEIRNSDLELIRSLANSMPELASTRMNLNLRIIGSSKQQRTLEGD